jgi:Immunoglobulin-like domain of bacterial spore germination
MHMDPMPDGRTSANREPTDRTKVALFVLAGLLAVAVVTLAAVLVLRGGDDGGVTAGPQPSPAPTSVTPSNATPTSPTGTSPAPTPQRTSPASISPEEARSVVWPKPGNGRLYDDPVAAAAGMATGLVGFTDPVVGAFQQGDSRSGEVDIRPKSTGPVTTVLVRHLSDGHWYAIGASSGDLRLTTPDVGTSVSSPVAVSGFSTAFEGTIVVSVLAQGDPAPLGREPLIGGANGDVGPFSGHIRFAAPAAGGPGAIVLTTDSAEDGRIWQATVVPVRLTP